MVGSHPVPLASNKIALAAHGFRVEFAPAFVAGTADCPATDLDSSDPFSMRVSSACQNGISLDGALLHALDAAG
jgi:hypothetical protein